MARGFSAVRASRTVQRAVTSVESMPPRGAPTSARPSGVSRRVRALILSVVLLTALGCGGRDETARRRGDIVTSEIPYERINLSYPDELDPSPDDTILKVACRNYADFIVDYTLNDNVIILDDPGLLRSAELLDGPFGGSEAALLAEQTLLRHDEDPEAALEDLRSDSELDDEDLDEAEQYLAARALPPTEDAVDNYVVYVANTTIRAALVVRLPLRNDVVLSPSSHASGAPLATQLPDGSIVGIAESACLLDGDDA